MLQDSNMYFNYIFLENLNLWVLLFYGRLLPQTEMKRLCKITLDSSGWGCGIWITKIFSTVNCGVPKLQWLNLPMFWFPNWNIWYTVFRYTKLSFVLWCRRTNERKRSGEKIMEKAGLLHILSFGIQLAGSQSRLHNSSEWQTAQKFALGWCKKLYM